MMVLLLKWMGRNIFTAFFWLLLFSVNVNNRTVFSYAYDWVIMNEYVQEADLALVSMWSRVYDSALLTYAQLGKSDESSAVH